MIWQNRKQVLIIAGPTASGKTGIAIKLAKKYDAEVINADSLQVYKENPIISAQPSLEEQSSVKHHLLGYVSGHETYNIHRWITDVRQIIANSQKPIIIVGGTGFFIKHLVFGFCELPEIPVEIRDATRNLHNKIGAKEFHKLLQELDPLAAELLDQNNSHRAMRAYEVIKATGKTLKHWQENNHVKYFPISRFKLVTLAPNRELLYQNCNMRFLQMLESGVLDEVRYLLEKKFNPDTGIMKSHGVPELSKFISGEWSLNQAIEKSQQVVRNYAKRQTTWFKHQFIHPDLDLEFIDPKVCSF